MERSVSVSRVLTALALTGAVSICGLLSGCFGSSSGGASDNGSIEYAPSETPVKGGSIQTNIPGWPENLRVYGTKANTYLNSIIDSLCYESLCSIDSDTLEFKPALAEKWEISDDKMTFTFHLNPKARWSDGTPVTSADVLATYKLIMDETLIDPMTRAAMEKMKPPIAKSDHLVVVEAREKDWRNFITFSGMIVLPAHEIGKLTGKEYLDKYNFALTAVSGAYRIDPGDIKTDESLTLTRRQDYWAAEEPWNKGYFNFDKIRFVVVRKSRLAFDKTCKGELDFYDVRTAQWWVQDLPKLKSVERGHLVRQKVFTRVPKGIQGFAFNMRIAPLDDLSVRLALGHLFDRKTMLEKFAFNEYIPLKSYFPGGDSENPNNQLVEYDPRKADALLAKAGWGQRGSDGIRVKNGKRLSMTVLYISEGLEKYFTVWQQACLKAGVEIKLKRVTMASQWQSQMSRKFQVVSTGWIGSLFPYPRANFYSGMADKEGSNNITGFKNKQADAIIDEYDKEFDLAKRTQLLKRLDGVIFNQHPYSLAWYLPCERILYWNKFGMPKTVLPKYGDVRDVYARWWVDPEKTKKLKQARKSGKSLIPIPPLELHPWQEGGTVARTSAESHR